MLSKSEQRKLAAREKEWNEALKPFNKVLDAVKKEVRRDYRAMMNFMMYYKKPKDKIDRGIHFVLWWLAIGFIFFAFKGFTYWLTGR